tara:strand:+ start:2992 stop:3642 length:651 start_codon:yes stop_codon:yes gene_type:complete
MFNKIKIITIISLIFASLAAPSEAANNALFDTVEFKSKSLKSVPKWTEILDKMVTEKQQVETCKENISSCENRFYKQWLRFIAKAKTIQDKELLLDEVNSFFNDWEYILDIDNWGMSDYWEIPSEFLEMSGDCEDYSIIKYYTLRKLGYKADQLRLVVLKDTVRNGAHAVLAVYEGDSIYILDNLSTIALTDDLLTQYVPYYSINEDYKWVHFKKM